MCTVDCNNISKFVSQKLKQLDLLKLTKMSSMNTLETKIFSSQNFINILKIKSSEFHNIIQEHLMYKLLINKEVIDFLFMLK